MITYPLPRFDQLKSEVLQRYRILDGSSCYDTNHLAHTVALVFGAPIVIAALNERYRAWFRSTHGVDDAHYDRLQTFCALANLADSAFCVEDVRNEPFFGQDPAVLEDPGIVAFAGAPLRNPDGQRFGTLCLLDTAPRTIDEPMLKTLQSFADLLSSDICVRSAGRYAIRDLIEAEEDKCSLYNLAMTDPLTGALNRRAFYHFTEREVRRSARHKLNMTAIMIDIDHFKKVNDVHGHAAGDEVLRTMIRTVIRNVRDEDFVGRLGGEEFALVLPETTPAQAEILCNRLREVIKLLDFDGEGGQFRISVSIGISEPHPGDQDINPALERADRALYVAKRSGRDQVRIATDDVMKQSA